MTSGQTGRITRRTPTLGQTSPSPDWSTCAALSAKRVPRMLLSPLEVGARHLVCSEGRSWAWLEDVDRRRSAPGADKGLWPLPLRPVSAKDRGVRPFLAFVVAALIAAGCTADDDGAAPAASTLAATAAAKPPRAPSRGGTSGCSTRSSSDHSWTPTVTGSVTSQD